MIQANELRIGNAFNHKKYGFVILQKEDFVDFDFEDLEGIPITKEWLVQKLGFKEDIILPSREFNLSLGGQIVKMINHYENGWLLKLHWWEAGVKVEYIHDLQNLIIVNTKEELTCK